MTKPKLVMEVEITPKTHKGIADIVFSYDEKSSKLHKLKPRSRKRDRTKLKEAKSYTIQMNQNRQNVD